MKRKVVSCLLVLLCSVMNLSLQAQDSLKTVLKESVADPKTNMFVPLYEKSNPDFLSSQTIRYAVKWGSFGLIPGAFWGKHEVIGTPAIITSVVAVPVLGMIGGYFGRKYGMKLNKLKSSNPELSSKLYTVGHELGYEKLFSSESDDYEIDSSPKYSIVVQKRSDSFYIPEEYRIGFSWKLWHDINSSDEFELWESRCNFDLLFNSSGKTFQFHYGLGGGYSWGELKAYTDSQSTKTVVNDGIFFFYPIAGITANAYDFFYIRIEGKYEYSEFYSKMTGFFGDVENGNFSIGFSFGTYLF